MSSERGVWFKAIRRVIEPKMRRQNVIPRSFRRLNFIGFEITTLGVRVGFGDWREYLGRGF